MSILDNKPLLLHLKTLLAAQSGKESNKFWHVGNCLQLDSSDLVFHSISNHRQVRIVLHPSLGFKEIK